MMRRRAVEAMVAAVVGVVSFLVPVAQVSAATSVSVTPATGLSGGQDVAIVVSGLVPGHTGGWCQGVPSVGPATTNDCGTNTTYPATVDATGQVSGVARLQRFIYVPSLLRWVDCADPVETCVIGAGDAADIAGTVTRASLSFAAPPDPPVTRGTLRLTPSSAGFVVTGSGFRPGAAVDVHECATGADDPSGCGFAKATATASATGGFAVTVQPDPSVEPAGGSTVTCVPLETRACSIVAAEAVDFTGTNVGVALPLPAEFPPTVLPAVVSKVEGNAGAADFDVRVSLSHASLLPVTAEWTTWFLSGRTDNQADPTTDYAPASGTVTFAPGTTEQTVPIAVNGERLVEPDEYIVVSFHDPTDAVIGGFFGLGLAFITNDDQVTIVPGVGSVAEGSSGTTDVPVPVTLSNPSTQAVTVEWTTLSVAGAPPGQADPATDYTPSSGTVTFAPGETARTVSVAIDGDTVPEGDEYVIVSFRNPINARMGGFWGLGIAGFTNDD